MTKKSWLAKRHSQKKLDDLSAFSTVASDNLINLSIGDPDYTTPEAIIEAAFADAKAGQTHYTSGLGQLELREAVCQDLTTTQNLIAPVEHCMITTSACHAMWLTMESILDEGDEVIVFSPYFTMYGDQIRLARGVPVDCPTDAENGFAIDFERLKASVTDKTKAIIINTPNNPTGQCNSEAELRQLAECAIQYDLLLIADDVYTVFSYKKPHFALGSLPEITDRVVTLGSFSKNYYMTGWRIGFAIAPPALIAAMENINQGVIFSPPTISQRAALHAIHLKDQVQPALIETMRKRAEVAYQAFSSINGIRCLEPAGGMYIFPNVTGTGMSSREFADFVLEKADVRVIVGDGFGQAGVGHVRIALTVSEEKLVEAAERIKRVLG